jgi:hypothetical protein
MKLNIIEEGKRAWNSGMGFINNPYHVWDQKEQYLSWSKGWWELNDESAAIDREVLAQEHEDMVRKEEEAKELKEKQKTKKGRAELAGQTTMF